MKKVDAIDRIKKQIVAIDEVRQRGRSDLLFNKWRGDTIVLLEYVFGKNHRHSSRFLGIRYSLGNITNLTAEEQFVAAFNRGLDGATVALESMIAEILEYWEEEEGGTDRDKHPSRSEITAAQASMPSLFVGSSVEGLSIAEAIQLNLDFVAEVTLWYQGVFGLSQGTLETLVNRVSSFDFAILVLTPDDVSIKREVVGNAPRDNVLFELGLFMGALGRNRTFIVHPRGTSMQMPSDLAGVTMASYAPARSDGNLQAALGAVCTQLKREMARLGRRAATSP